MVCRSEFARFFIQVNLWTFETLVTWLRHSISCFLCCFARVFFSVLRATIFSTCIHYKLNIEGKITYLYSLLRTDLDSRHFAPIVRFFKNLIAIVSGYGQKFIKHLLRALLLFKAEVSIVWFVWNVIGFVRKVIKKVIKNIYI